MTATDELREMLDERGIEYEQSYIEGIASYTHTTKWETQTGNMCAFCEVEDGHPPYFTRLDIWTPTPEQVIAATVGCEACHLALKDDHEEYGEAFHIWWECDECGVTIPRTVGMPELRYCPSCGRRVVE